ncbi:MAG: TPM domain-containing protein, partial [Parascardovia denticolens]
VYVLSKDDRRDRLEVGYGLEDVVPDSDAASFIKLGEEEYKDDDYDSGVRKVVGALARRVDDPLYDPADESDKGDGFSSVFSLIIALVVIGLILLIGRLASYVRYRREMKSGGGKGGKGPSGKVSFSEWLNSNGSGGGTLMAAVPLAVEEPPGAGRFLHRPPWPFWLESTWTPDSWVREWGLRKA